MKIGAAQDCADGFQVVLFNQCSYFKTKGGHMSTIISECSGGGKVNLLLGVFQEKNRYSLVEIAELGEMAGLKRGEAKRLLRHLVLRRMVDMYSREEKTPKLYLLTHLGKKRMAALRHDAVRSDDIAIKRASRKKVHKTGVLSSNKNEESKFYGNGIKGNSQLWISALHCLFHDDSEKKLGKEEFIQALSKKRVSPDGKIISLSEHEVALMLRSMKRADMVHMNGNGIITLSKQGCLVLYNAFGINSYPCVSTKKKESYGMLREIAIEIGIITHAWKGGIRSLKKRISETLADFFFRIYASCFLLCPVNFAA
jgi:hypothetical protein